MSINFIRGATNVQPVLLVQVVAEIPTPDPAGSPSDLGLLPGGRVKLLKSSSFALDNPARCVILIVFLNIQTMAEIPRGAIKELKKHKTNFRVRENF